jgi:very-short-patch-repair endonuclease
MSNTTRARQLRKSSTDAERKLWSILRNRNLNDHKFRRQHPLPPYIVDFACLEKNLIVEADGGQHADNPQDKQRDTFLGNKGFRVLRFWNNDVLQNVEGVAMIILNALENPHPDPLRGEEGQGRRFLASEEISPLRSSPSEKDASLNPLSGRGLGEGNPVLQERE